jgi:SAM-dependent methyltransferase
MSRATALHGDHGLLSSDACFDVVFPASQRIRSHFHWTPVEVAMRACELVAPSPATRVLDIGSGVGKLCLVGALLESRVRWCGIERDAAQVRVARAAARRLGVEKYVQFIHGDFASIEPTSFDAFYFFNPFGETLLEREQPRSHRWNAFRREIERARELLLATRPGTRVVTYHGFGGDMPNCFDLVHCEGAMTDELCLWIRR